MKQKTDVVLTLIYSFTADYKIGRDVFLEKVEVISKAYPALNKGSGVSQYVLGLHFGKEFPFIFYNQNLQVHSIDFKQSNILENHLIDNGDLIHGGKKRFTGHVYNVVGSSFNEKEYVGKIKDDIKSFVNLGYKVL